MIFSLVVYWLLYQLSEIRSEHLLNYFHATVWNMIN